jgi:hypothetical protein
MRIMKCLLLRGIVLLLPDGLRPKIGMAQEAPASLGGAVSDTIGAVIPDHVTTLISAKAGVVCTT